MRAGRQKSPGLIVLSCAAAEHNAQHLLEAAIACAVARHAQPGYLRYLVSDNAFCATLSDCAEWLIEADEKTAARLPLPKSDAVRCVPDLSPYALRRTRMLGGAGAMAAVCACLAGVETLGEAFKEEDIRTLLGQGADGGNAARCWLFPHGKSAIRRAGMLLSGKCLRRRKMA